MPRNRPATIEEADSIGWHEDWVLKQVDVRTDDDGTVWWSLLSESNTGVSVPADGYSAPEPGHTIRIYGGFGFRIVGWRFGDRHWWLTPEQEEADHQVMLAKMQAKREADFAANKERLDAEYEALPPEFKVRIDKFRNTLDNWRVEYEPYEMSVCVDAVKIANWIIATYPDFKESPGWNQDAIIKQFSTTTAEQDEAGVSHDHSGNSFGWAVRLAVHYLINPHLVAHDHGALTPLVGCEAYGCPHWKEPSDA